MVEVTRRCSKITFNHQWKHKELAHIRVSDFKTISRGFNSRRAFSAPIHSVKQWAAINPAPRQQCAGMVPYSGSRSVDFNPRLSDHGANTLTTELSPPFFNSLFSPLPQSLWWFSHNNLKLKMSCNIAESPLFLLTKTVRAVNGETHENDISVWIGERAQSVIVLLTCCIPEC